MKEMASLVTSSIAPEVAITNPTTDTEYNNNGSICAALDCAVASQGVGMTFAFYHRQSKVGTVASSSDLLNTTAAYVAAAGVIIFAGKETSMYLSSGYGVHLFELVKGYGFQLKLANIQWPSASAGSGAVTGSLAVDFDAAIKTGGSLAFTGDVNVIGGASAIAFVASQAGAVATSGGKAGLGLAAKGLDEVVKGLECAAKSSA